jgi:hypothetical protein
MCSRPPTAQVGRSNGRGDDAEPAPRDAMGLGILERMTNRDASVARGEAREGPLPVEMVPEDLRTPDWALRPAETGMPPDGRRRATMDPGMRPTRPTILGPPGGGTR